MTKRLSEAIPWPDLREFLTDMDRTLLVLEEFAKVNPDAASVYLVLYSIYKVRTNENTET